LTPDTYSPELNKRGRSHLKPVNKSYRVDETYRRVKGADKYLYRAVDSTGQTINFLLTAKRDTAAAKRFLRNVIDASGNGMPRVMNVDENPAYPAALEVLKVDGVIPGQAVLTEERANNGGRGQGPGGQGPFEPQLLACVHVRGRTRRAGRNSCPGVVGPADPL
jgi:transposase-like protein